MQFKDPCLLNSGRWKRSEIKCPDVESQMSECVKSQLERLTAMCRLHKQEKVVHNPILGCLLDVPFETNPTEYMAGNIRLVACCNLS